MTHRTPLITLAAVAAYLLALLVANMVIHPGASADSAGAGTPAQGPASPPPSPRDGPAAPITPAAPSTAPEAQTPSSGPASPEDDDELASRVVYVGRTDDGIAVAVAVLNGRAAAYVCDGSRLESWLRGRVDGDEVTLSDREGTRVEARLDNGQLEGEVEGEDETHDFTLDRASEPAGLYRARGSRTTIGWIVLPDGSQVGLATDDRGASTPAPRLDPGDSRVRVDGEDVTAEPVTGETNL